MAEKVNATVRKWQVLRAMESCLVGCKSSLNRINENEMEEINPNHVTGGPSVKVPIYQGSALVGCLGVTWR